MKVQYLFISGRERIKWRKEKILSKKLYVDKIISRDAKKTGILVAFDNIPEAVYGAVGRYFNPVEEENYLPDEVLMAEDLYLEKEKGFP